MKYYVMEAATPKTGTEAIGVTAKESIDEAMMLYHQICASKRADATVTKATVVVINDAGANVICESFTKSE